MFPRQIPGRFGHPPDIKGRIGVAGKPAPARRRKAGIIYDVLIGLDGVTESRVKTGRHLPRALHADLCGQAHIERARKLLRWDPALRIKHCQIAKRMHAGIGAAGPAHLDGSARQLCERSVQFSLYGRDSAFLRLEPRIPCAVIGDSEQYSLHIQYSGPFRTGSSLRCRRQKREAG